MNIFYLIKLNIPTIRFALKKKNDVTVQIKRNNKDKNYDYFGPYPNSGAAYRIVDLINKIFPIRKCNKIPSTTCLYYHLGQCIAPCINKIPQETYDEMRAVDVTKWTEKRDGADYLNWAKVVDLLHENGAGTVYFEPVVNQLTGSSLYMTDQVYTDKSGNTNRVYETAVKVVIDDLEFIQRGPVTNGSNPVKDNSMTQQRLWNCQTRLFVKGVAIRTGLGFDLWLKEENRNDKGDDDDCRHKDP